MKEQFTIINEQQMLALGGQLTQIIKEGDVVFLKGQLGAGKTTLVRGFLQALGYKGIVPSPTYTLVEYYDFAGKIIYHIDLYRLQNTNELAAIGIQDYLDGKSIGFIEWPPNDSHWLCANWQCNITVHDQHRLVILRCV